MADQPPPRRILGDSSNTVGPLHFNSIAIPADNGTNMVMNLALIQLVQSNQFHGLSNENPYNHLTVFGEICNTVKINGVSDDRVRLNLFPCSLGGNAKDWLHSFPEGLLRKTPVHGFDKTSYLLALLGGLRTQSKMMLDALARGSINRKTEDEAYELIEDMAINEVMQSERGVQKGGLLQLLADDAMVAQNHLLTQKLDKLTKVLSELPRGIRNISQTQQLCDLCSGDHINGQCAFTEEMQGNTNKGNSSQGWKNHPSIGQNQNTSSGQGGNFRQQQPSPLWQQMSSLTKTVRELNDRFDKFLKVYESQQASDQASFRALETQIG
ncbi:uncharacterized protein LOC106780681 [Vigna radiata var. radiata]|uniref:Uncharacterized protein LOC106780681 n=1 Tax=Vigna radiata var. radiata TaxID=3916 RepID=A0A1S3W1P0_VIGRR|nr:uncharacterized protein LOC106780681 [Vigna radiata var. radiata]